MSKRDIMAAFADVEQKVRELQSAIDNLHELHSPHSLGLDEWSELLGDAVDELEEDIREAFYA